MGTTGTVPSSTSATLCHAASEVEPSTSSTRGSGESTGTQPSYTIRRAWASTRLPSRQTPGRWAE